MADVIDFTPRANSNAPNDSVKPSETCQDTIRILDFWSEKAKKGEITGVLVLALDGDSQRYEHAFSTPPDEDPSNAALRMTGALEFAKSDLLRFAHITGGYEINPIVVELFDPKDSK